MQIEQGEKNCEIKGGGQRNSCDGGLVANILIRITQVNMYSSMNISILLCILLYILL